MSFEFSLEVLLEHKRRLQDEARRVWAEAQAKVDDAVNELNGFYKQVDDTRLTNQTLEKSGGALASRLVMNDGFIEGQKIRIERQRLKIRDLKSAAEILHEQMVEAARETKTLEKLKEKRKEEFKKKMRVREMKENDEIVTLRHKRDAWGTENT
jgi:flagellar protein FliJ